MTDDDVSRDVTPATPTVDVRSLEAALRGAGLSRRQAKTLLAEGLGALATGVVERDEHDDGVLEALRQAAKALRSGDADRT